MIEIVVNGEKTSVSAGANIKDMIRELNYIQEGYSVALNGIFVAIARYETTIIQENDTIEILSPVQGG